MRYGIPYQGSKNQIARKIIDFLPSADNFYDLFAGGCAISHCASLSNKFKNIYANDINAEPLQLFQDAIHGKFQHEKRWISREDFFALKDKEPYVKYCWSFANNCKDYMYSKKIEHWKKALHYARVLQDFSLFEEMGIHTDATKQDIIHNKEEYITKYNKTLNVSGKCLSSLENLERLQGLKKLEQTNIIFSSQDYADVTVNANSIIYCDIPYQNTNVDGYADTLDYERFFDWADSINTPVFISSYEITDGRFAEVWQTTKQNNRNRKNVTEKIYVQNKFKGVVK